MGPSRRAGDAPDADAEDIARRFAWFGKLPSAGDFVSRRMPYAVRQFWDRWCADGMDALKASSGASGLDVWGATPKWAFLLPGQPGVPTGQLGVFAPSCDRVGRIFPFIVVAPLVPDQQSVLVDRAAALGLAWGEAVGQAQAARLGIDALDAGLHAALAETLAGEPDEDDDDDRTTLPLGIDPAPAPLPWPRLSRDFDMRGSQSYWWSVPPTATGYQARLHHGPLMTLHFLDLCR
ncbi:MAG: type VI secretion system-associated protein TagF [Ramlibacter sp.]|nr:type VI secretion system-associated protein TagF [Ramlibacter sp.]